MREDPEIYVIDANCLDHIDARPDANLVWAIITQLIEQGRLKTVEQVMNEIQGVNPGAFERLRPYRRQMVERIDFELLSEAGRISQTYRRMSRWRHPNDSADPWLVAAAKLRGYVVVTDEHRRRQRIPVVCDREGVLCRSLTEFVEDEMPEE